MTTLFPFGFPLATAFYLVLLVVTLVVHVVFMNYVLAGSGYLAIAGLRRRPKGAQPRPMVALLRDWMPFALGVAITAGVAPLLFVQILYQERFYTANLLLLHRWMAILPVLIVAFYVLYVMKSRWAGARRVRRTTLGLIAALCFFFIAWSWTENYLLSLQSPETWASFYESKQVFYRDARLLPRLLMWGLGAIPSLAVLAGWQMRAGIRRGRLGDDTPVDAEAAHKVARHLAWLGLGGLVLTGLAAALYGVVSPAAREMATASALATPYFVAAALGVVLQIYAWLRIRSRGTLGAFPLWLATAGWILGLLGMTVVREGIRLQAVDLKGLLSQHERALEIGGFPVFVIFSVLVIVVLVVALRKVSKELQAQDSATDT